MGHTDASQLTEWLQQNLSFLWKRHSLGMPVTSDVYIFYQSGWQQKPISLVVKPFARITRSEIFTLSNRILPLLMATGKQDQS